MLPAPDAGPPVRPVLSPGRIEDLPMLQVSARFVVVLLVAALTMAAAPVGAQLPEKEQVPDQVSASHILIQYQGAARAPESVTRSKEEALALAQEVATMAKEEGADFAELARKYSDGPSASRGGNLFNFGPRQMVPPFSNAVLALEIGGISDPVETQFGYHVIKRQEVKPLPKASAKHILVMYQGSMRAPANITRSKEEALARCQEALDRLHNGEKFEDLAREYSDGPTGPRGGDLGEFTMGRMAPEFETATFDCKVGETTGIVETAFGYHIILRYK
jgi:peptidyl-prolyl cis-trans isomerase SurA